MEEGKEEEKEEERRCGLAGQTAELQASMKTGERCMHDRIM